MYTFWKHSIQMLSFVIEDAGFVDFLCNLDDN